MNVAILGAGYVGLTTGVALAYLGAQVKCFDTDQPKLDLLRNGRLPIHEPGLEELMATASANLCFSADCAGAISGADVIFITVGTPSLSDGRPDLQCVRAVAETIGRHLRDGFTVVVIKSTVPVGTAGWVGELIRRASEDSAGRCADGRFAIASNPEFLREGTALHDTLFPDRIVVGASDPRARAVLALLYRPILEQRFPAPDFLPRPKGRSAVPLVSTDLASAELIKYGANAFLALKVSFINEIAQLAERAGADVTEVAQGVGLDYRIGTRFLQAGIGWGGSCFGKDTAALVFLGGQYGLSLPIVRAAREVNRGQRVRVIEKLQSELGDLEGRTIGLLGLAFKPNTDDLRDAPALDIARLLLDRGAGVRAHDPIALGRAKREHPKLAIHYCDSPEEAAADADALVLVTDWPQYLDLTWERLALALRTPLIVDGRNFLDRDRLQRAGFKYLGMGRQDREPAAMPARLVSQAKRPSSLANKVFA